MDQFTIIATPTSVSLPAADDAASVDVNELVFEVYFSSPIAGAVISNAMQIDGSWLTPGTPDDVSAPGAGSAFKLKFTAAPNTGAASRKGTIEVFFDAGTQSQVVAIDVNQLGVGAPAISVMPAIVTVPNALPAAGVVSAELVLLGAETLAANQPVITVLPSDWLTAAASADKTKIELTVTAENTAVDARNAVMYVVAEQGGTTQMIEVGITQPGTGGAAVDIQKISYEIDAAAQAFDIPALGLNGTTYEVIGWTPAAMFTAAPAANTEQTAITADIPANESTKPRTAEIVLLATNGDDNQFYSIAIHQAGIDAPNLIPAVTEVYVAATGTVTPVAVPFIDYDALYTFLPLAFVNQDMFGPATAVATVAAPATATLNIAVTANTTLNERTGVIRIPAQRGGQTQILEVRVIQAAAGAPTLIFPEVVFEYGPAAVAGANIFYENPNGATVALKGTAPAWMTTPDTTTSGLVSFDLAENNTAESRTAKLMFEATTAEGNTALYSVTVIQAGKGALAASLATPNITAPWEAGAITDKIMVIGLPEGIAAADVTSVSTAGWLTAATATVNGNTAELALTATANPATSDRFATVIVTVTRGAETQNLTAMVVQQGAPAPQIQMATDKLTIPANAVANDTFGVDIINTNGATLTYEVKSSDTGFVTGTAATDVLTVTLASGPNDTTVEKSATVTVLATANGVTTTSTLEVVQLAKGAPELNLSANSLIFGSPAQAGAVLHFANPNGAAVTATYPTEPAGWIANAVIDDGIDDGAGSITFDVLANNTLEELNGQIILTAVSGGKTAYYRVGVTQKGIAPMNLTVVPVTIITGAEEELTAIANKTGIFGMPADAAATATSLSGWLTPTLTASTISFATEANETGRPRIGTVVIEITRGDEVQRYTVSVLQRAGAPLAAVPQVSADINSLTFNGGVPATPTTITLSGTDAAYTYEVSVPDWMTFTAPAGDPVAFTVIPNTENPSASSRTGVVEIFVKSGDKVQTDRKSVV
jgi:predicted small integral membrane protein